MRRRTTALAFVAALLLVLTVSVSSAAASSHRVGVFLLTLTGAEEVTSTCAPPAVCGDPDAIARMVIVVIPQRDKVCFVTRWRGIDGTVVAAHIHPAPRGVAGPVAVPLFEGTFRSSDRTHGCVTAPAGVAAAIVADPSGYYVNIHSTVYPPGAVRAQLA